MSKEYPCVYYDNEKCKKFSEDGFTSWCVLGPCSHETPSNADRIRAMSDEELAKEMLFFCPTDTVFKGEDTYGKPHYTGLDGAITQHRKKWLHQILSGSNSLREVLTMRIETAEKKLREEYERTKKLEFIHDPVAWALYQVWKMADGGADHE